MGRKYEAIPGTRYNFLTIIEETAPRGKERFIKCQCDCGNITDVKFAYLRNGHTKSCGCYQKKHKIKKDMIGKRFGSLVVLDYSHGNQGSYWKCQCDCGTIITVSGNSLNSGTQKSCGCSRIIDITGQKFHMLTVIEATDQRLGNEIVWKCQCDCGTINYQRGSRLRHGYIWSCGCIKSKGEQEIIKYLQANQIPYKKEYYFNDLKIKLPLRFDFAIFDINNNLQCLIEYQGEQHYNTKKEWGKQQREISDQMKVNYCLRNNILLHTIAYNENLEDRLNEIFQK